MARLLDDASTQYFTRAFGGSWAAAIPISMSIWFRIDDLSVSQSIFAYECDNGVKGDYIRIMYHSSNEIRAQHYEESDGTDQCAVAMNDNDWHLAVAIFRSTSYRAIFLDGSGTTANDSTANSALTLTRQTIGYLEYHATQPMSGGVAEAAIWVNHELTNDQIDMLADGYSPMLVYPQQLSYYWPCLGTIPDLTDWVAKEYSGTAERQDLTVNNGPISRTDHPGSIIYPWQGAL